jgi:hypothetical protein
MNADAILSAFICDPLRFKKSSCYFIAIALAAPGVDDFSHP